MTLSEIIVSLLQRLGHGRHSDTLAFEEVRYWPPQAFSHLLQEKIIEPTTPAKTIDCPGCPENCFKRVHTLPGKPGEPPRHVIACDETNHMGKIPILPERLQQWRITDQLVALWLIKKLGLRSLPAQSKIPSELPIGILLNAKSRCQLALSSVNELSLKVNQLSLPLVEVLYVEDEQLAIDQVAIESLAQQSLSVHSKTNYQPSTVRREARKLDTQAMYAEWRKAYKELKRKHPDKTLVWISKQIAKMEIAQGRDSETIRKKLQN